MLPVAPRCALMAGYRLALQFPAIEPLIVTTDRLCCKGITAGVPAVPPVSVNFSMNQSDKDPYGG